MRVGGQRYASPTLPLGKIPGAHCIGDRVGPRAGLDGCGKSRLPRGFDPRTVQPVASRYTDWAIPARHNPAYSHLLWKPIRWFLICSRQTDRHEQVNSRILENFCCERAKKICYCVMLREWYVVIRISPSAFYYIQGVPLPTKPGISLIILKQMKILQRDLNRSTFVVWEMKGNVSVVCVCFVAISSLVLELLTHWWRGHLNCLNACYRGF